jgi:hypothetical protein
MQPGLPQVGMTPTPPQALQFSLVPALQLGHESHSWLLAQRSLASSIPQS